MRALTLLVVLAALAGCVSIAPRHVEVKVVHESNYALNVERSAAVGDAMMQLRDYQGARAGALHPNTTCAARYIMFDRTLTPDDSLPIVGSIPCGDELCSVVNLWSDPIYGPIGVAVTPDGRMTGGGIRTAMHTRMGGHPRMTPNNCRLGTATDRVDIVPGTAFTNFEIIYGGMDGQTLNFTYREYTPDDLARPAFTQAFSYPAGSATIRFKNVEIAVAEALPDRIRYTVLRDGTTR